MRVLRLFLGTILLITSLLSVKATEQPLTLAYISPRPSAQRVMPATALAVRQGEPLDPRSSDQRLFTVVGSKSGPHTGVARLSDDQRTLLFYPDRPFAYDEVVSVTIDPGLATADGRSIAGLTYQFSTLTQPPPQLPAKPSAAYDPYADLAPQSPQPAAALQSPTYRSEPGLQNTMPVSVVTPATATAEGLIFVSGIGFAYNPSVHIVDNTGEPIFIKTFPQDMRAADLKVQSVGGTPYLTYHVGDIRGGWTYGKTYVLDQSYTLVDTWTIGNDQADMHEFLLLENGHALLLAYSPVQYDLSAYGGRADAIVIEAVIQEQDSAKNVVFEWRSLDHIAIEDTSVALTTPIVDYIHTNAIEVDWDGNLLISNRHTDDIIKINRVDGEVIWRLGGKRNEFKFVPNGDTFSHQHDIRRLPNGQITLYDNGNSKDPEHSRAVGYAIDEVTKVVTRTWQYPTESTIFAPFMGNAQRLSNGNTMIGWGGYSYATEVTSDGTVALELFLGNEYSYRAFRFPWEATPQQAPRLAITSSADPADTSASLYFSWNGATGIESYEIYAGPTSDSLTLTDTVPRSGFETSAVLSGLDSSSCVLRVRPVHQDGLTTLFSNYVYRFNQPGCLANFAGVQFLPLAGR